MPFGFGHISFNCLHNLVRNFSPRLEVNFVIGQLFEEIILSYLVVLRMCQEVATSVEGPGCQTLAQTFG